MMPIGLPFIYSLILSSASIYEASRTHSLSMGASSQDWLPHQTHALWRRPSLT